MKGLNMKYSTQNDLIIKIFFTMAEAKVYTGFSYSYLYKLTHQNKIPYYKPQGKLIFFKKEEIDQWLGQNRIASKSELQQKPKDYQTKKGGK